MIFDPFTFDPVPARGKLERVTKEPYACEAKLDGVRQVLTIRDGEVIMTGRRNSVHTGQKLNKAAWVPHITEEVLRVLESTVLDGELYVPGGTSNQVVSIFGSACDVALDRQYVGVNGTPLHYRVFDAIKLNGEDLREEEYRRRRAILVNLFNRIDVIHLELVPQFVAPTVDEAYASAIQAGFEGLVVKTLSGTYDSKAWAKMKPTNTYDYVFCGIDESTSETYAGWGAAAMILGLYVDGELRPYTRCSGMIDSMRKELFDNWKNYVGKVVEVVAQQQFETGALRHPRFQRFRHDLDALQQTTAKYNLTNPVMLAN